MHCSSEAPSSSRHLASWLLSLRRVSAARRSPPYALPVLARLASRGADGAMARSSISADPLDQSFATHLSNRHGRIRTPRLPLRRRRSDRNQHVLHQRHTVGIYGLSERFAYRRQASRSPGRARDRGVNASWRVRSAPWESADPSCDHGRRGEGNYRAAPRLGRGRLRLLSSRVPDLQRDSRGPACARVSRSTCR